MLDINWFQRYWYHDALWESKAGRFDWIDPFQWEPQIVDMFSTNYPSFSVHMCACFKRLEGLSTTTYFQTSKISSNWCQVIIPLKHFRELQQTPKSHTSFLLGIADL